MLRTPPKKGKEKIPPRPRRPAKSSEPPQHPVIETEEDFDRVLRGLLAVPPAGATAAGKRRRGR
jgi:hypothetical protein